MLNLCYSTFKNLFWHFFNKFEAYIDIFNLPSVFINILIIKVCLVIAVCKLNEAVFLFISSWFLICCSCFHRLPCNFWLDVRQCSENIVGYWCCYHSSKRDKFSLSSQSTSGPTQLGWELVLDFIRVGLFHFCSYF